MAPPRAQTLFRLSGLIACAFLGLPRVFRSTQVVHDDWHRGGLGAFYDMHERAVWWAALVIAILVISAFGAAFWKVTDPQAKRRTRLILLAIQSVVAVGDSEYLIVIAAQLPFTLSARWAFRWMLVQVTMFAALGFSSYFFPEAPGAAPAVPWNPSSPLAITYSLGLQLFSFAVGYVAANERRARAELERRNRELQAAETMLDASSRLAERARISRELHDTIGHHLTVLSVNLEVLRHHADERTLDAVLAARTVTRLMLADVREVVSTLRQDRAIDLKLALSMLADKTGSPMVHLQVAEDAEVTDPACAHAVFRCAQEAITNAVRHAEARHVWIDLAPTDDGIELHVRDDGRGSHSIIVGNGLRGMRERVEEIGGRLDLSTQPGAGFGVRARIPDGAVTT
jgi:signal transduction histidine kinase